MLVGAVLAPTDPVFASAIVGRRDVPARLRRLLSVESGLNDGLALPVVVILDQRRREPRERRARRYRVRGPRARRGSRPRPRAAGADPPAAPHPRPRRRAAAPATRAAGGRHPAVRGRAPDRGERLSRRVRRRSGRRPAEPGGAGSVLRARRPARRAREVRRPARLRRPAHAEPVRQHRCRRLGRRRPLAGPRPARLAGALAARQPLGAQGALRRRLVRTEGFRLRGVRAAGAPFRYSAGHGRLPADRGQHRSEHRRPLQHRCPGRQALRRRADRRCPRGRARGRSGVGHAGPPGPG